MIFSYDQLNFAIFSLDRRFCDFFFFPAIDWWISIFFSATDWKISRFFSHDWLPNFTKFTYDRLMNFTIFESNWLKNFVIFSNDCMTISWIFFPHNWLTNFMIFYFYRLVNFAGGFLATDWQNSWIFFAYSQWMNFMNSPSHGWLTNFILFYCKQLVNFWISPRYLLAKLEFFFFSCDTNYFFPMTDWRILWSFSITNCQISLFFLLNDRLTNFTTCLWSDDEIYIYFPQSLDIFHEFFPLQREKEKNQQSMSNMAARDTSCIK